MNKPNVTSTKEVTYNVTLTGLTQAEFDHLVETVGKANSGPNNYGSAFYKALTDMRKAS